MQSGGLIALAVVTVGLAVADVAMTRTITPLLPSTSEEVAQIKLPEKRDKAEQKSVSAPAKSELKSQENFEPQPKKKASRSAMPEPQDCADMPSKTARLTCFKTIFKRQMRGEEPQSTLAVVGQWKINIRRLANDSFGRVIIRSINQQEEAQDGERTKAQFLYAACRRGLRSVWVKYDNPLRERRDNIAVEMSVDNEAFATVFMDTSRNYEALGIWGNTHATEFLKRVSDSRNTRIRVGSSEISQIPATFDTTDMDRALEPLEIACK